MSEKNFKRVNIVTALKKELQGIEEVYRGQDQVLLRISRDNKGFSGRINEASIKFRTRKDVEKYIKKKGFKFEKITRRLRDESQ